MNFIKPFSNLSFRSRITLLTAGVMVLGGAIILAVQYYLVRDLFYSPTGLIELSFIDPSSILLIPGDSSTAPILNNPGLGVNLLPGLPSVSDGLRFVDSSAFVTQLSAVVLRRMFLWSLALLGLFTIAALVLGRWIASQSVRRLQAITQSASSITRQDIHRRLNLPGPQDEIKELGDTIDNMLDRLEETFERQDRFIAGASHELRTPLATTRTLLEIPLHTGRFPAEVENNVREALAANARSERLIAALLTLAQAQQRQTNPHTWQACETGDPSAYCDLRQMLSNVVSERSLSISDRQLTVGLALGNDQQMTGEINPGMAEIAISNLVDNAIKHAPIGSNIECQITRTANCQIAISISNPGTDLNATDLSKLLEPFHRGENSRLAGGGLGLGLSLVDSICKATGSTLTLTPLPAPKFGLCATLTIPACDAHPAAG